MKKGQMILLSICTLSLCVVFGIFLGRNLPNNYIPQTQISATSATDSPTVSAVTPHEKSGHLDLNLATKAQLMDLPGIGEVLAQRILDYRQTQGSFHSIDELLNVEGIGEKTLEQIEPFLKIGG